MWQLKSVQPYEIRICNLTNEKMFANDWYYENTETKQVILYEAYHQLKKRVVENSFSYEKLNAANNRAEYKQRLKDYQSQALEEMIIENLLKENILNQSTNREEGLK